MHYPINSCRIKNCDTKSIDLVSHKLNFMKILKLTLSGTLLFFLLLAAQRFFHIIPTLPQGDNTGLFFGTISAFFIVFLMLSVVKMIKGLD